MSAASSSCSSPAGHRVSTGPLPMNVPGSVPEDSEDDLGASQSPKSPPSRKKAGRGGPFGRRAGNDTGTASTPLTSVVPAPVGRARLRGSAPSAGAGASSGDGAASSSAYGSAGTDSGAGVGRLLGSMTSLGVDHRMKGSGSPSPSSLHDDTTSHTTRHSASSFSHRQSLGSLASASAASANGRRSRSVATSRSFASKAPSRFFSFSNAALRSSPFKRKVVAKCRVLIKDRFFQGAMFMALLAALFLPDVWILANRPNNQDLDVILTLVFFMFLFELTTQSLGQFRTYFRSFFFYMDLVGAFSLILDLSYLNILGLLGADGSSSQNSMVVRAARIAKVGARAGRFTRLVKLLRFLPGMQDHNAPTTGAQGAAKRLSARLVTALSTRTSVLIIVMVVVMPLFSMWTFPEADWSMQGGLVRLEQVAGLGSPERFERQLRRYEAFYASMSYFPVLLEAKPSAGALLPAEVLAGLPWRATAPRGPPARATNTLRLESTHFLCDFNFEAPNQVDAGMSLCLLVFIMILMVGFSLMLSKKISTVVLAPLENLLEKIRQTAAVIFKSVTDMATNNLKPDAEQSDDEDEEDQELDTTNMFKFEMGLLSKVVRKLGELNERTKGAENEVDADDALGLTDLDRVLINGFFASGSGVPPRDDMEHKFSQDAEALRLEDTQKGVDELLATAEEGEEEKEEPAVGREETGGSSLPRAYPSTSTLTALDQIDDVLFQQRSMLENSGLSLDLLNSWNLNPLELDRARGHAAAMYFLGPHNHSVHMEQETLSAFLERAEAGYMKTIPYHTWFHAVDVTHCIYRLMTICRSEEYLSPVERYSMLLSAICHDLGHPGLNNSFLIETSHEWALRYNDRSPLENMHAAKMFEILGDTTCDVMACLSKADHHEARRVCVEAILHTDNSRHFTMIKDIQMCYEVDSEILEASRACFREDCLDFPTTEAAHCFRKPEFRKLFTHLFLRLADISNSVKPFRICRIWASQVLEEFFMQGDLEKKLGVPVQASNDRERVNRPLSQVGFIEFLVSPLLLPIVRMLPPLEPTFEIMVQNVILWHQVWLSETKPPPSQEERGVLEDRIRKLQNKLIDLDQ